MRRRSVLFIALAVVLGTLSGCSATQVHLWFLVNAGQELSPAEAWKIADRINEGAVPGCDDNYWGVCVPDNATDVDCAGTGDGPVWVRGPLLVTNWDHFGLDPDGDQVACQPRPAPPAPAPPAPLTTFGAVRVGVGSGPGLVPPGRYVTTGTLQDPCLWARVNGRGDILGGNLEVVGLEFMDLRQGDRLETKGRCTWRPAAAAAYPLPASLEFGGRVGREIQPGVLRIGRSATCRWQLLSSFDGAPGSVLDSGPLGYPSLVAIDADHVGFSSHGCGAWTKLDAVPTRRIELDGDPWSVIGDVTATWIPGLDPIEIEGANDQLHIRTDQLRIVFAAPDRQQLEVGRYEGTVRFPSNFSQPGLSVGSACNAEFGWFEIHELERDGDGRFVHVVAEFEQHCVEADGPAVRGYVSL